MPLGRLFANCSPGSHSFYTSIADCLSSSEQEKLAKVCRAGKGLVDSVDANHFRTLASTSTYKNWDGLKFTSNARQVLIPKMDKELENSGRALTIPRTEGRFFASMVKRVQYAEKVEIKKAENLIQFFQVLSQGIPEAQTFMGSLNPDQNIKEIAKAMREWMESNPGLLSRVSSLGGNEGLRLYFSEVGTTMPPEVLLLTGIPEEEFFRICQYSLVNNYLYLNREIIKAPRLLQLPPNWLGALLMSSVRGDVPHFIAFLMSSAAFAQVPARYIADSFEIASQNANIPIIQLFVQHPRFREIPELRIDQALEKTILKKAPRLVETLIQDSRFRLIDVSSLNQSICNALRTKQVGIAKTLLSTERALSISYADLKDTLKTAYHHDALRELRTFFNVYGRNGSLPAFPPSSQTMRFGRHGREAIAVIRKEFDDYATSDSDVDFDSDSDSDVEMSDRENGAQLSPSGKRRREDDNEGSERQRRKLDS